VDDGTEIRLFDPRRDPRDWIDLLGPTQCAVFVKDRKTSSSLAPDGRSYPSPDATTCLVFDSIDAAQQYCQAKVQGLPHLRCEIYDKQGLAQPPLLVVVHPDFYADEDSGPRWSRRRKQIVGGLVSVSILLLWAGVHWSSDLFPFLAFTCIVLALRFLYWDAGVRHKDRERRSRLEAHRRKEQGDA